MVNTLFWRVKFEALLVSVDRVTFRGLGRLQETILNVYRAYRLQWSNYVLYLLKFSSLAIFVRLLKYLLTHNRLCVVGTSGIT
jgi:hypothetical protein